MCDLLTDSSFYSASPPPTDCQLPDAFLKLRPSSELLPILPTVYSTPAADGTPPQTLENSGEAHSESSPPPSFPTFVTSITTHTIAGGQTWNGSFPPHAPNPPHHLTNNAEASSVHSTSTVKLESSHSSPSCSAFLFKPPGPQAWKSLLPGLSSPSFAAPQSILYIIAILLNGI